MLENAVYSILSPEGFASILYKDSTRCEEAAEKMKITAEDLKKLDIIDEIVKEPYNGAHEDIEKMCQILKKQILKNIKELQKLDTKKLLEMRYEKFRKMGTKMVE